MRIHLKRWSEDDQELIRNIYRLICFLEFGGITDKNSCFYFLSKVKDLVDLYPNKIALKNYYISTKLKFEEIGNIPAVRSQLRLESITYGLFYDLYIKPHK